MIKTLKASNGSFASLGNPQVQSTNDDPDNAIDSNVRTPTSVKSPGSSAPHQTGISSTTLSYTSSDLNVNNDQTMETVATTMMNDESYMLPPQHATANDVSLSYASSVDPKTGEQSHDDVRQTTTKKLEPYELLTGISHERPEIVMLTNFLPLFSDDVGHSNPSFIEHVENGGIYPFMTDAGKFIDLQIQTRSLRHTNVVKVLRGLKSDYQHVKRSFAARRRSFEKNVDSLLTISNFLFELVRGTERLKLQLDVRSNIHSVDPRVIINQYLLQFAKFNPAPQAMALAMAEFANRYLPTTYTVSDALVRLGYDADNIKNTFSSTKIWMQLLLETKTLLQFHSAEFIDIDPVAQRHDNNAISVTRITTPHFSLKQSVPLPSINELSAIDISQIRKTVNDLGRVWLSLYKNTHFRTDESQIAALVNVVSKELRYSYGLSDQNVKRTLLEQFGFSVEPTKNDGVFDAIVGNVGNTITDFAAQSNSLVSVAQRQPALNVNVLTFESKYIDGDSGTLTPGSAYYVDQVLKTDGKKFNTTRLNELGDLLEKTSVSFGTVVNGMNLLSVSANDPYDKAHTQFLSVASNPVNLLKDLIESLVDQRTGITFPGIVSDNLGAVYSFAINDNHVKASLFLYTLARITRTYSSTASLFGTTLLQDNTPLTDALIESIITSLENSVPQTLTGNQNINNDLLIEKKFPTLTSDTIRASFKAGTTLTRFVETMMRQVLSMFRDNDRVSVDQRTRFNGYVDTTILMATFDVLVKMIAKYGNQSIVSINHGHTSSTQGVLTFNVSRAVVNHRSSLNDLVTRAEKEVALTHKLVYAIMNTLQKLSNSFKSYSSYLESPPATSMLHDVAGLINDPNLLQMLMSEQQIMLLASTVHDLVDRVTQATTLPDNGDVDGDGDFDADDELRILDDSKVSPRLRNVLYGLLNNAEYASKKGYNKKILTVGIPLAFTHRLKQRVSIQNLKRSTFVNKQSDVVSFSVYKVDLQNSDIVYKPQKFLFELSRFPVRNDKHFLDVPKRPTIDDVVHAVPTRDFGEGQLQGSEITYWSLNTDDVSKGRKATFADETYSFLSPDEKAQIVKNHTVSYLLENYVKLMTGVSVADYHFDIVEPPRPLDGELVKLIVEHYVATAANIANVHKTSVYEQDQQPTGGVLFATTTAKKHGFVAGGGASSQSHPAVTNPQYSNAAGSGGDVTSTAQFDSLQSTSTTKTVEAQQSIGRLSDNLSSVTRKNASTVLHGLRTISNASRMITPLADSLAVSKKIVSPKQFDRVFNVIVDPDEFEIDYEKTVKTPHGKRSLEQLIANGDVVTLTENNVAERRTKSSRHFVSGRSPDEHALYGFRDRDKLQGDMTLEKYFITVETYGEENV